MEFYNNIPNNPQMMNPPNYMMMGMNQMNFLNMDYNTNENNIMMNQLEKKIEINTINFIHSDNSRIHIHISPDEKVSDLIEKYRKVACDYGQSKKFIFSGKNLNLELTVAEAGLFNSANIFVVNTINVKGGGCWYMKEINIKFITISKNYNKKNDNKQIIGLLKLCLLKEVSQKINFDKLKVLPEMVFYILKILSNGYIEQEPDDSKKSIRDVLEKLKGSNILTYSNYVDETIDSYLINNILNLLDKKDSIKMHYLKNLLSNYNDCIKLFNKEFIQAQKESIFEFSIISLVIIEREDFEKFEEERKKCPNIAEKILYHGTSIKPASKILTGLYEKSLENYNTIHGKGVYFTDILDYAWYYGGEKGKRANFSGIPKIGDTFTIIINHIYYNMYGYKKVNDNKRTPGKNEINFAYAGARSERLSNPDKNKFYGTEYVIYELDQICPFMSAKLKRVEYCVIWRDNNFSTQPVYNNKFDQIFKSFLKERLKYINQYSKYNIYACETSEEALKLVNRKKYNKIILISNVGTDFGGKKFIDDARKIIGNNVIALFLAYKSSHVDWIKKYENALFSNDPKFYEEYLQCFDEENDGTIKYNIEELVKKMEEHYKVKFNFNERYLDYPKFLENGNYGDLRF